MRAAPKTPRRAGLAALGEHPLRGHAGLAGGRQIKCPEQERERGCGVKGLQSQTAVKEEKIDSERQSEGVAGRQAGQVTKGWSVSVPSGQLRLLPGRYGRWDSSSPRDSRQSLSFQTTAFQRNGFQLLEKHTPGLEETDAERSQGGEEGFANLSCSFE